MIVHKRYLACLWQVSGLCVCQSWLSRRVEAAFNLSTFLPTIVIPPVYMVCLFGFYFHPEIYTKSIHPIHNTTWRTTVLHPYNFFVYYEACLNHVKTFCNPTCFFNEVLFSCLPGHTNMQISKVLKYNFYVLLMNYMQHEWWLLSSISLPVWQMKWHLVNLTI